MAASAGWAASARAGSTERSPMTPRWHSTKSNAVVRGSLIGSRCRTHQAKTPATLSSIISSSLQSMPARISSQCSLNSGDRLGGAGAPPNCTGVVTRVKGVPSAVAVWPEVAVGLDLHVLRDLDAVLGHGPLALEVGEALPPLAQGRRLEGLLEDGACLAGVGGQLLVGGEPLVGDQLLAADDPAGARPVAEPLRHEKARNRLSWVRKVPTRGFGRLMPPPLLGPGARACRAGATRRWRGSWPTCPRRAARRRGAGPHPCAPGGRARR